ncbi:hypothetical protein ALC62_12005 [Cyphomyrmex costatus]|uniref:Uncharacterized protein n=1 Tax=Cyphomyrmex costatus TaxID=456900 RepID=A0A195C8W8_9HYME|nr:hypothetical protein ALC62_12005 [Cyphomyrmex costatus]
MYYSQFAAIHLGGDAVNRFELLVTSLSHSRCFNDYYRSVGKHLPATSPAPSLKEEKDKSKAGCRGVDFRGGWRANREDTTHVRRERRSSRDCARRGVAALDLLPLRRPTRESPPPSPAPAAAIPSSSRVYRYRGRVPLLWSSLGCWFTLSLADSSGTHLRRTPQPEIPPSSRSRSLLSSPDFAAKLPRSG